MEFTASGFTHPIPPSTPFNFLQPPDTCRLTPDTFLIAPLHRYDVFFRNNYLRPDNK
jgi:hypothetical protein